MTVLRLLLAILLAGIPAIQPVARAADSERFRIFVNDGHDWEPAVVNGEFGFLGFSNEPVKKDVLELPVIQPRVALQKLGDTLKVYVDESDRKAYKKSVEKHLWYLTSDYSDKVPKVKLTEQPNEFSRWRIVAAGDSDEDIRETRHRVYIQNINSGGKDAWLIMQDMGTYYKGGHEFRRAMLSLDDKQVFAIPGPHYGGR
jgi:hypothetical protein